MIKFLIIRCGEWNDNQSCLLVWNVLHCSSSTHTSLSSRANHNFNSFWFVCLAFTPHFNPVALQSLKTGVLQQKKHKIVDIQWLCRTLGCSALYLQNIIALLHVERERESKQINKQALSTQSERKIVPIVIVHFAFSHYGFLITHRIHSPLRCCCSSFCAQFTGNYSCLDLK